MTIEGKALSAAEIRDRMEKTAPHDQAEHFDGKSVFEKLSEPAMNQAVSVSAWIRIERGTAGANYIVSKGESDKAYSLGLTGGCCAGASMEHTCKPNGPLSCTSGCMSRGPSMGTGCRYTSMAK